MLAEIFTHCVDRTTPLNVDAGEWVISRVCRKWREMAIACPHLWAHFVFPGPSPKNARRRLERFLKKNARSQLERILETKLQRARNTALFIRFRNQGSRSDGILGMLFAFSPQWKEIAFDDKHDVFRFLKHGRRATFPQLRKLELDGPEPLLDEDDSNESTRFDTIASLPALRDVSMNLHRQSFPPQLLPWSQARRCVLRNPKLSDVLAIISLLPLAASASIMDVEPGRSPPTPTESRIGALELYSSVLGHIDFLDVLRAPFLKKLVLSRAYSVNKTFQIAQFLGRSGCTLEHLRIEYGSDSSILGILTLPRMKGVVRLDLYSTTCLRYLLEALGKVDSSLAPSLRTLVWRKRSDFDEALDVMGLLRHRNPSVRSFPFGRWEWEFPESGYGSDGGLDLVILEEGIYERLCLSLSTNGPVAIFEIEENTSRLSGMLEMGPVACCTSWY
ncbi:hypothetical protein FB45DRAFT_1001170 [Roridomyces roridus]|uniref:F-box domain-containing protein n=1 Tax=Roridomyces roridus TaxID=1738132 RepID=A0AAD7C565_9AGAR|nr:hypothetical protein FB45DRAFT_1001170 [Roridomyces roridus]